MGRTMGVLALALVVVACGVGGGTSGSGPATASQGPAASSSVPPASAGSLDPAIIEPIVADAARRLGVDPSAVAIVSARTETFSDGSLGCPRPGEMYTQALVDGYTVIVEANGTQLDYRGSAPGEFRLCESP